MFCWKNCVNSGLYYSATSNNIQLSWTGWLTNEVLVVYLKMMVGTTAKQYTKLRTCPKHKSALVKSYTVLSKTIIKLHRAKSSYSNNEICTQLISICRQHFHCPVKMRTAFWRNCYGQTIFSNHSLWKNMTIREVRTSLWSQRKDIKIVSSVLWGWAGEAIKDARYMLHSSRCTLLSL